jgi:hypothetical protein
MEASGFASSSPFFPVFFYDTMYNHKEMAGGLTILAGMVWRGSIEQGMAWKRSFGNFGRHSLVIPLQTARHGKASRFLNLAGVRMQLLQFFSFFCARRRVVIDEMWWIYHK